MGVDVTTNVLYGYKLPNEIIGKLYQDDEYSEYVDDGIEHNGMNYSFVIDGMSGDYLFFGIVLSQLDQGSEEIFKFTPPDYTNETSRYLQQKSEEIFDKFDIKIQESPSLYVFNHFH